MRECEKCKGNGYLIVGADKYGTRKTVRCPVCKGHGLIFEESPKDFAGVDLGNGWSIQAGKRTRADKIRAMSDEELAIWIYHERCKQSDGWYEQRGHTVEEVKDWLKQEEEE